MNRKPPPTDADKKRIANAVRNGVTIKDAAARFGVIPDAVREACREHDVATPKGGKRL